MGRTAAEIKEAMQTTIDDLDPTIETDRGPIHDSVLQPTSSEMENSEARVDRLEQLFSTEFIQTSTEDDVLAYITNFTLSEGGGKKATGTVIFATFTAIEAGEVLTVPEGILVANIDNTLVYQTTEEKTIVGDNISNFFNATQAWYEVSVPIEAVSPGEAFNLPKERIRSLLTPIVGVDVVTNRVRIRGGEEQEDKEKRFQRVITAFQGQDNGTVTGITKKVQDSNPEVIKGVAIVRSSERDLFKRFISQLAIDVYINGTEETNTTEEQTALQDTFTVTPEKQPVVSIESVLVNGVTRTDFQLEKDISLLQGSLSASDNILFETELVAGDIVSYVINYNSILEDVKNNVFADDEDNLFDMDILVREILEKQVELSGTVKISSSASIDEVIADVTDELTVLIETDENGVTYVPETIRQQLIEKIPGLSDFFWRKFTLSVEGTVGIEIIELDKNAIAKVDADKLLIT